MLSTRQILGISLAISVLGFTIFYYFAQINIAFYNYSGDGIKNFHYLQTEELPDSKSKITGGSGESSQMFDFKIRSFNVRVDTHNRFPHEHRWNERKVGVINSLKQLDQDVPTLIGLQELKHHQLNDILKGLNGESADSEYPWIHYGVGRDDGHLAGEYAPIIYNSEEWRLLNGTSRWLSSEPKKPVKSWGAATKRVITFATLQNIKLGNVINFINTHLDHKSKRAKMKSAKLIIHWINSIPNEYPTFLSGDFNSLSSGIAYQKIATKMNDANLDAVTHLNDTLITYTGFETNQEETTIDFIWSTSGNCSHIKVSNFATLSNQDSQGMLFSDHRPIEAEFIVAVDSSIQ